MNFSQRNKISRSLTALFLLCCWLFSGIGVISWMNSEENTSIGISVEHSQVESSQNLPDLNRFISYLFEESEETDSSNEDEKYEQDFYFLSYSDLSNQNANDNYLNGSLKSLSNTRNSVPLYILHHSLKIHFS